MDEDEDVSGPSRPQLSDESELNTVQRLTRTNFLLAHIYSDLDLPDLHLGKCFDCVKQTSPQFCCFVKQVILSTKSSPDSRPEFLCRTTILSSLLETFGLKLFLR